MRLLIDLNVILDVLLDRPPNADVAATVWAAVEAGKAQGRLSAHAVTTLHYLAARGRGRVFGERCVREVTSIFAVSPVDARVIHRALSLGFSDFEDAVTAAAAEADRCDAIVSRDARGFRDAPLPMLDPAAALTAIRLGP